MILDFRKISAVPIDGTGGCVDKSPDLCIPGGDQHIQKTVDIILVGRRRIGDGSGYRTQGRFLQHDIDTLASFPAERIIPDIPRDQAKPGGLPRSDLGQSVFDIFLKAG